MIFYYLKKKKLPNTIVYFNIDIKKDLYNIKWADLNKLNGHRPRDEAR